MSDEKNRCNRCKGTGQIQCPGCGGSGKSRRIDESTKRSKVSSCAGCNGKGTRTCGVCGGSGTI